MKILAIFDINNAKEDMKEQNLGPIPYMEQEAGWLADSGIVLEDATVIPDLISLPFLEAKIVDSYIERSQKVNEETLKKLAMGVDAEMGNKEDRDDL